MIFAFSINSFSSLGTLKNLNEDVLKVIEKFVKEELSVLLAAEYDLLDEEQNEADNIYFYGIFAAKPHRFRFLSGEIIAITAISKLAKSCETDNFKSANPVSERIYRANTIQLAIGTFFGKKRVPKKTVEPTDPVSLQESLTSIIKKAVLVVSPDLDFQERKLEMNITVKKIGTKITAYLNCIYCIDKGEKDKVKHIQYYVPANSNKGYWSANNFKKHLRDKHCNAASPKREDQTPKTSPNISVKVPAKPKTSTTSSQDNWIIIPSTPRAPKLSHNIRAQDNVKNQKFFKQKCLGATIKEKNKTIYVPVNLNKGSSNPNNLKKQLRDKNTSAASPKYDDKTPKTSPNLSVKLPATPKTSTTSSNDNSMIICSTPRASQLSRTIRTQDDVKTQNISNQKFLGATMKEKTKTIYVPVNLNKGSSNANNLKKHMRDKNTSTASPKYDDQTPKTSSNASVKLHATPKTSTTNSHDNSMIISSTPRAPQLSQNIRTLEDAIYQQISNQKLRLLEATMKHKTRKYTMNYSFGDKKCKIRIAKMDKDGSCLFSAIQHQLSCCKPNTDDHYASRNDLRAEAVNYLGKNLNTVLFSVTGRILDERDDIKDANRKVTEKDCLDFITNKLSKHETWGGFESMHAISIIHKANILVFNESESFYFAIGFELEYEKTVIIAYRNRDHYDSVVEIDQDDLFNIVKYLATRTNK